MTREEAIRILSTRDAHGVLCGYTSGVTEALDIAIESLQKDIHRDETVIRASERFLGIVRCKDCKHGQYDATHYFCAEHHHKVYEDDYCSHGERRSNREEEINGFKSVGQAWNTSQGRWEK